MLTNFILLRATTTNKAMVPCASHVWLVTIATRAARLCVRHARQAITVTRPVSRAARRAALASINRRSPPRRRRVACRVWPAITVRTMRQRDLCRATSINIVRPEPSNSCRVRCSIRHLSFQRLNYINLLIILIYFVRS